jgi:hypothetical protein
MDMGNSRCGCGTGHTAGVPGVQGGSLAENENIFQLEKNKAFAKENKLCTY